MPDTIKNPELFNALKTNRIETGNSEVNLDEKLVNALRKNTYKNNISPTVMTPDVVPVGDIVPDSKYLNENIPFSMLDQTQELLAQRQPTSHKIANAIAGGVGGGLLTALEEAGYLTDIIGRLDRFKTFDEIQDSSIAKVAREAKEQFYQNTVPIYRRDPNNAIDLSDRGFYWDTFRSVVESAIGFGIPGMAIGKGFNALGQSLKLSKGLTEVLGTIGTAIATNYGEGKQMAMQTYAANVDKLDNDIKSKIAEDIAMSNPDLGPDRILELTESRFSEEKQKPDYISKKNAIGKEADKIVDWNRAFILSDATTLFGSITGKNMLAKGLMKKSFGQFAKTAAKQIPIEGLEEMSQNVIQSEFDYQGAKAAGLDVSKYDSNVGKRAIDSFFSEESLLQGIMGGISGPLQFAAVQARPYFKGITANNTAYAKEVSDDENLNTFVSSNLGNIANAEVKRNIAIKNGDLVSAEDINESNFVERTASALERNGGKRLKEELNSIIDGKPIEGVDNAPTIAKQLLGQVNQLEKDYVKQVRSEKASSKEDEQLNQRYRKSLFVVNQDLKRYNGLLNNSNKEIDNEVKRLESLKAGILESYNKQLHPKISELVQAQTELHSIEDHIDELKKIHQDEQTGYDELLNQKKYIQDFKDKFSDKNKVVQIIENKDGTTSKVIREVKVGDKDIAKYTSDDLLAFATHKLLNNKKLSQEELGWVQSELVKLWDRPTVKMKPELQQEVRSLMNLVSDQFESITKEQNENGVISDHVDIGLDFNKFGIKLGQYSDKLNLYDNEIDVNNKLLESKQKSLDNINKELKDLQLGVEYVKANEYEKLLDSNSELSEIRKLHKQKQNILTAIRRTEERRQQYSDTKWKKENYQKELDLSKSMDMSQILNEVKQQQKEEENEFRTKNSNKVFKITYKNGKGEDASANVVLNPHNENELLSLDTLRGLNSGVPTSRSTFSLKAYRDQINDSNDVTNDVQFTAEELTKYIDLTRDKEQDPSSLTTNAIGPNNPSPENDESFGTDKEWVPESKPDFNFYKTTGHDYFESAPFSAPELVYNVKRDYGIDITEEQAKEIIDANLRWYTVMEYIQVGEKSPYKLMLVTSKSAPANVLSRVTFLQKSDMSTEGDIKTILVDNKNIPVEIDGKLIYTSMPLATYISKWGTVEGSGNSRFTFKKNNIDQLPNVQYSNDEELIAAIKDEDIKLRAKTTLDEYADFRKYIYEMETPISYSIGAKSSGMETGSSDSEIHSISDTIMDNGDKTTLHSLDVSVATGEPGNSYINNYGEQIATIPGAIYLKYKQQIYKLKSRKLNPKEIVNLVRLLQLYSSRAITSGNNKEANTIKVGNNVYNIFETINNMISFGKQSYKSTQKYGIQYSNGNIIFGPDQIKLSEQELVKYSIAHNSKEDTIELSDDASDEMKQFVEFLKTKIHHVNNKTLRSTATNKTANEKYTKQVVMLSVSQSIGEDGLPINTIEDNQKAINYQTYLLSKGPNGSTPILGTTTKKISNNLRNGSTLNTKISSEQFNNAKLNRGKIGIYLKINTNREHVSTVPKSNPVVNSIIVKEGSKLPNTDIENVVQITSDRISLDPSGVVSTFVTLDGITNRTQQPVSFTLKISVDNNGLITVGAISKHDGPIGEVLQTILNHNDWKNILKAISESGTTIGNLHDISKMLFDQAFSNFPLDNLKTTYYESIGIPTPVIQKLSSISDELDLSKEIHSHDVDAFMLADDTVRDYFKTTQKERDWFAKTFPNIPVEIVNGLIKSKAYGQFVNGAKVLISDIAKTGTYYHEAYHVVSLAMTTPDERVSMYNAYRSYYTTESLSDKEVEEKLAEMFREYMISDGYYNIPKKKISSIFKRILEFIKSFFGVSEYQKFSTTLKDQFESIRNGNIKSNIHQESTYDPMLEIQGADFTRAMNDSVNTYFFRELFAEDAVMFDDIFNMDSKAYSEKYKDKISNIYDRVGGLMLGSLGDHIRSLDALYNKEVNKPNKDVNYINSIVDEVNTLMHLYKNIAGKVEGSTLWNDIVAEHIKTLEKFNIKISFDSDFDENDTATQTNDTPAYVSTMEFPQKEKATAIIKMLVAGLPSSTIVDGNIKLEKNSYGMLTCVNYHDTFNFLHSNLAGIQGFYDQIDKLKSLIPIVPSLSWVVKRLGVEGDGNYTPTSLSYNKTLLQNQFHQQFQKTMMEPYITLITKDENGLSEIITTNSQSVNLVKHIIDKWENTGRFIASSGGGILSISRAGEVVVDINKQIKLSSGNVVSVSSASKATIADRIELLSNLGINLLDNNISQNLDDNAIGLFNDDINRIFASINNKTNTTHSLSVLYNKGDNDAVGRVKNIANIFSKNNKYSVEVQHINPDGKTIYGIALNSFLSMLANEYNTGNIPEFITGWDETKNEFTSAFTKNSEWLHLLKNQEGKMSFVYLEGTKQESNPGITIEKATNGDRLMVQINAVLDGISPFLRAADNKIERGVKMSGFGLKMTTDQFVGKLFGYLEDEVNSSIEYLNSANKVGTKYYDKNIQKLRFFKDIIKTNNNAIDLSKFNSLDEFIEKYGKENIIKQLESYANGLVKDTRKLLFDNGVFVMDGGDIKNIGISTSKVKEFTGHSINVLSEDQAESIVGTYAYNFVIGNIEQTKLFVGDIAFYNNKSKQDNTEFSLSDFFKRMRGVVSTKKMVRTDDQINTWMDVNLARSDGKQHTDTFNTIVFDDPIYASELPMYDGKEEADGQGYISLDAYRELMFKQGEWRSNQEDLYKWIMSKNKGEKVGVKPSAIFPPLKPQYFGPSMNEDVNGFKPVFYKFSVLPIYTGLFNNGEQLGKLASEMEKNQIDIALMETANKVGALTINGKLHPFYNSDGTMSDIDINFNQKINLKYFGTQLDIAPEFHNKVIYGTQFRTLIFSDIYANGLPLNQRLADLAGEMNTIIRELIDFDLKELVSNMGMEVDENGNYRFINNDKDAIRNVVASEMVRRGFSQNDLDGWDYVINHENTFVDFMSSRERVENMLFALVRNRVVNQKMNGDMLVLAASTGWETKPRSQKNNAWASNMETLKFYTKKENGGVNNMEVYLPNMFRNYVKAGYTLNIRNGKIYDNRNNFLHTESELFNVIGFRIPTSGLNSIETMTIKGFLPEEAGSTIVVPSDLVDKAGSDYDIDKMTVFIPNHFMDAEGKIRYIKSIDQYESYLTSHKGSKRKMSQEEFGQLVKQNRLIAITQEILTDPASSKNLLEPISVKAWEGVANKVIEKKGSTKKYSMFSPSQLSDMADKFWTGVGGIGIAAVNKTNHIKGQQAGLYIDIHPNNTIFDEINTMDVEGNTVVSLSGDKAVDGTYISETLNQMINAIVDIVKKPFLSDINMSSDTLDIYALLVRTGLSLDTVAYFMSQPIIVEYIKQVKLNASKFYKANYGQYVKSKKEIQIALSEKYGVEKQNIKALSIKHFSSSDLYNMLAPTHNSSYDEDQVRILSAYVQYGEIASDLTNVIQSNTQDTSANANRNDFFNRRLKLRYALRQVKDNRGRTSVIGNTDKLLSNTFMDKFEQVEMQGKKMFDGIFFAETNDSAKLLLDRVRSKILSLKIDTQSKEKAIAKMEVGMLNYLLQMETDSNGVKLNDRAKELLHGSNSVANRFLGYKGTSILKNELIAVLEGAKNTREEEAQNSYLKILNRRLDSYDTDELVDAFKELKSNDPILYNDIIDLLILTSGIGNSPISYKSILPSDDFYERMLTIVKGLPNKDLFTNKNVVDLIARNNWRDNVIVPIVTSYSKDDNGEISMSSYDAQKLPFGLCKVLSKTKKGQPAYFLYQVVEEDEDRSYLEMTSKLGFIGRVNYSNTPFNRETELGRELRSATEANFLGDYSEENSSEESEDEIIVIEEKNIIPTPYYEGNIKPDANTVFVFGSNPEGRHGAGAAKIAIQQFGAKYGQGEGLQGNSYALPTKDLRIKENNGLKSISSSKIIESIKRLYKVAMENPNKQFKVAYRNTTETSLNGYTGLEMINMFNSAGKIPSNIIFSKEWVSTGKFNGKNQIPIPSTNPSTYTNHSGGAIGADNTWGVVSSLFGNIKNKHYWLNNKTPYGNYEITKEDSIEGQKKVTIAARQMGRIEETHQVRDEKLIRNWAQVKYSDSIFAVIEGFYNIGDEMNYGKKAKIKQVKGGTGYAVQMAINEGKPVYVFNQSDNTWLKYDSGKWIKSDIPTLTTNFAGIGTRKLNEFGVEAMIDVMKKTFPNQPITTINPLKGVLGDKNWNDMNDEQKLIAFKCNFKI